MTRLSLIRPGLQVVARLDGREVKSDELTPLSITRSLGGAHGDQCLCRAHHDAEILVDTKVVPPTSKLEVETVDANGGRRRLFVGWGSGATFDMATETLHYEFRIARFHFGFPAFAMFEAFSDGSVFDTYRRQGDIVFNPIIDGAVRGNRGHKYPSPGEPYYFTDWEMLRTPAARKRQGVRYYSDGAWERNQKEMQWTLSTAVHHLCWKLNAAEQHITNPTLGELQAVFDDEGSKLRNVVIRVGSYLNEALDVMLGPLGYTWFVDPETTGKPRLRFVRRGRGTERFLQLQRPGDSFDAMRNNVYGGPIAAGSHGLVNGVAVIGGNKQHEVTIPLVPAWSNDLDTLGDEDTAKDSDNYQNKPSYQRVHRDFVANEAGDYVGLRPSIDSPLRLSNYYDDEERRVPPRRRKAWPCLTKLPDGAAAGDNGIVIEYRLREPGEPGEEGEEAEPASFGDWQPLETLWDFGTVAVLEQEIGFRFDGLFVPVDVQAAFQSYAEESPNIEFRMTCTIVSDDRLVGRAAPTGNSFQPDIAGEIIDAPDRFHFREVTKWSKYYPEWRSGRLQADVVDDSIAITEFAVRLRDAWDMLDFSGEPQLIGLDGVQYELGDVITHTLGRNIQFVAANGADGPRHPQVSQVHYDLVNHSRRLTLSTLRNERA